MDYEYKSVLMRGLAPCREKVLNEMAAEGWEYIDTDFNIANFKRPKPEKRLFGKDK